MATIKAIIVMPLGEERGGAEAALRHLISEKPGHLECAVVFLEAGPMVDEMRDLGAAVHVLEAGRVRQVHRYGATVVRLARLLKRERADVAVGWMTKGHIYVGPAALLAGIPAVWNHVAVPSPGSLVDRAATVMPARLVLTCSREAMVAQALLWPRRPVELVYPGVELAVFDPDRLPPPASMRQKLGLPVEGPLIGTVARLQQWKGVHVLVEAMRLVIRRHPEAHCVIVGGKHALEPDYPRRLQELIDSLGLADRVRMVGLQRNAAGWMQAMDVVAHTSDREPFGIVVIEAMALGKPVVAGSEGGPTEIITPGVDGLLAPYGDAGSLAEAIVRLLDDPGFATRLGAAARARAEEFSTARYAQGIYSALSRAIQSGSPPLR